MAFLFEPQPEYGVAVEMRDGVRRIVAPNPGPMTYHGTNTWLVDGDAGTVVIDPGPADLAHTDAIMSATGGKIASILLTHSHSDHSGGLPALAERSGAPVYAYASDALKEPHIAIADGDEVAGLTAIHTPGHSPDHLSFARDDGLLFTGDHVMTWSSSVVLPPLGTMADYLASLRLLLERNDVAYLPGHGPLMENPQAYVRELIARRLQREEQIFSALGGGVSGIPEIAAEVYAKIEPTARRAAEANVLAHLIKLQSDGRAFEEGKQWRQTG